jgi:DNA-binding MarR family transcriptional regulator
MTLSIEEKVSELMVQVHEILRRYRSRQRDFMKEADSGLTHREIDALFRLGMAGECTMSQLAQEIVQ